MEIVRRKEDEMLQRRGFLGVEKKGGAENEIEMKRGSFLKSAFSLMGNIVEETFLAENTGRTWMTTAPCLQVERSVTFPFLYTFSCPPRRPSSTRRVERPFWHWLKRITHYVHRQK